MNTVSLLRLSRNQMFTHLLLGLSAYIVAALFNLNVRNLPYLQQIMYAAIAVGLYINVASIEIDSFKKELKQITAVLVFGVPIKIILPGLALAWLSPSNAKIAFLCSTVIAQIDPIVASQSFKNIKFKKSSETILRAWSSFDDPVTVLFAFYIFLPISQGNSFNFIEYFISHILIDILVIGGIYFAYKKFLRPWYKRAKDEFVAAINTSIIGLVFAYGLLTSSFLAPAAVGLFVRPFKSSNTSNVISGIACFSAIIIGAFAANSIIDWQLGLILAMSMLVAHALATQFLIKESSYSKLKLMFSHQNGMTAILLTIGLEVSGQGMSNLLPITLPAIILIAFFYLFSNHVIALKRGNSIVDSGEQMNRND
jgi:NhaP-type Na+/H+ or K+/H+ antiporter